MVTALLVIVGIVIVGLFGYRKWRRHEEAKAAQEAMRVRILQAVHRNPRPWSEPASQGFQRRRG